MTGSSLWSAPSSQAAISQSRGGGRVPGRWLLVPWECPGLAMGTTPRCAVGQERRRRRGAGRDRGSSGSVQCLRTPRARGPGALGSMVSHGPPPWPPAAASSSDNLGNLQGAVRLAPSGPTFPGRARGALPSLGASSAGPCPWGPEGELPRRSRSRQRRRRRLGGSPRRGRPCDEG